MANALPHAVVVGIDGSPSSDLALDWAVDEAVRHQLPLHLVHARGMNDWWLVAGGPVPQELIDAPDELLEERVERVSRLAPALRVTSESSAGHAPQTLIALSRDATVVAMGARGRGPVTQVLLGSVSAQVAAHAQCPVVVVRRAPDSGREQAGVVVGIDGSRSCEHALDYAFARASARSLGLTVVHAWPIDLAAGLGSLTVSEHQHEAMAQERQAMVSEALAGRRAKYPDVEVREQILRAHPADALLAEALHGDLLVVGSRGLGGFAGLLLGSVSLALLNRATCPVAIVRPREGNE